MNEKMRTVKAVVTQTVTESLALLVTVPDDADAQEIANRAVAEGLDRERGWCVTDNPWAVEIVEDDGTVSAPLSPDFDAVDVIRGEGLS